MFTVRDGDACQLQESCMFFHVVHAKRAIELAGVELFFRLFLPMLVSLRNKKSFGKRVKSISHALTIYATLFTFMLYTRRQLLLSTEVTKV